MPPDSRIISPSARVVPAAVSPQAGMRYRAGALADPTGKLAAGCSTLLLLPSAAYGTASSLNPSVFSTQYINSMALDITVSAVSGGASPTFQFILERKDANGNWDSILSTLVGPAPPVTFSIDVGPFSVGYGGINTAQHAVFTQQARIRWVYNNNPTSYTFSVSVIGR